MSDLASVRILDVWQRLGGGELRHGRGRAFWRDGDGPNIALDAEQGLWFDHVSGVGGGVLALIETALQCDRREALAWLETEDFIEHRHPTSGERREYAQRWEAASLVASDTAHWRDALTSDLNEQKRIALADEDYDALEQAAQLCNLIENGSPETCIREFLRQRQADPQRVAQLIEAGQQLDSESRRIAAVVVHLLVQSEDSARAA